MYVYLHGDSLSVHHIANRKSVICPSRFLWTHSVFDSRFVARTFSSRFGALFSWIFQSSRTRKSRVWRHLMYRTFNDTLYRAKLLPKPPLKCGGLLSATCSLVYILQYNNIIISMYVIESRNRGKLSCPTFLENSFDSYSTACLGPFFELVFWTMFLVYIFTAARNAYKLTWTRRKMELCFHLTLSRMYCL